MHKALMHMLDDGKVLINAIKNTHVFVFVIGMELGRLGAIAFTAGLAVMIIEIGVLPIIEKCSVLLNLDFQ